MNVIDCNANQNELTEKILSYMFEGTKYFQIIKNDHYVNNEVYFSIIKSDELEKIRIELEKSIKIVEKYKADAAPFGGFERGYRAMFIVKKDDIELHAILYSPEEEMIIVREKDIFPELPLDLPEITVYKCKVSKNVIDILATHEKELLENGDFITTFPLYLD